VAGKGRQSWEKRQREKAKRDKQTAKRADREDRKNTEPEEAGDEDGPSETELYARFAKLSEAYAAGDVDEETFEEKRAELFEQLGLETH
jgi:hypothetical protein